MTSCRGLCEPGGLRGQGGILPLWVHTLESRWHRVNIDVQMDNAFFSVIPFILIYLKFLCNLRVFP